MTHKIPPPFHNGTRPPQSDEITKVKEGIIEVPFDCCLPSGYLDVTSIEDAIRGVRVGVRGLPNE